MTIEDYLKQTKLQRLLGQFEHTTLNDWDYKCDICLKHYQKAPYWSIEGFEEIIVIVCENCMKDIKEGK